MTSSSINIKKALPSDCLELEKMVLSTKTSYRFDQAAVITLHIKPVQCGYKVTCIIIISC